MARKKKRRKVYENRMGAAARNADQAQEAVGKVAGHRILKFPEQSATFVRSSHFSIEMNFRSSVDFSKNDMRSSGLLE